MEPAAGGSVSPVSPWSELDGMEAAADTLATTSAKAMMAGASDFVFMAFSIQGRVETINRRICRN